MSEIKMNIAMLCAYMKMSTETLAKNAGIDPVHLTAVRAGRATMTADDIVALTELTGLSVRQIETKKDKQ